MRALSIILCVIMLSCGAKKKAIQKGEELTAELKAETLKEVSVINELATAELRKIYVATTTKKGSRIILKPTGPGPIHYSDGVKDITVSGANVIIEDYEIKEIIKDSLSNNTSSTKTQQSQKDQEKVQVSQSKKVWRNVQSTILRVPTWLWILLIIAIALYVYRKWLPW